MLNKKARKRLLQEAQSYVESRLRLGDEIAAILGGLEEAFGPRPPGRSTVYGWAKEWREARARDRSGPWSLAIDQTGRPDIVMRILAALVGRSRGESTEVTAAEARWAVKIAKAVPDILLDRQYLEAGHEGEAPRPARPAWGSLTLWEWATRYVDAETAGDSGRLVELDALVAALYANGGRHFPELMTDEQEARRPMTIRVIEQWHSASRETEYELLVAIPRTEAPIEGDVVEIPGLGRCLVRTVQPARRPGMKLAPGEVLATLDITTTVEEARPA